MYKESDSNVVIVSIIGQELKLRYNDNIEKEKIINVANMVNSKVTDLQNKYHGVSTLNLMTLVCLNIGNDLMDYQTKYDQSVSKTTEAFKDLVQTIDQKLVEI